MSNLQWTFFSNHAHVIFILYRNPNITMKDIAHEVGITERAVHQIIKELKEADYISSERNGRKNSYKVKLNRPLRHAIEKHKKVSDLVSLINVDL